MRKTLAVLSLALATTATAQGTLIPVSGARGHVFDSFRNVLYIPTTNGREWASGSWRP